CNVAPIRPTEACSRVRQGAEAILRFALITRVQSNTPSSLNLPNGALHELSSRLQTCVARQCGRPTDCVCLAREIASEWPRRIQQDSYAPIPGRWGGARTTALLLRARLEPNQSSIRL